MHTRVGVCEFVYLWWCELVCELIYYYLYSKGLLRIQATTAESVTAGSRQAPACVVTTISTSTRRA